MKLLSFDTEKRILRLDLAGTSPGDLPGRLASLVMVACDCGLEGIVCDETVMPEGPLRSAVSSLIKNNPLFAVEPEESREESRDDFGYRLVSRDEDLLCLGDASDTGSYSIFLSPSMDSAGKASVFAYLITNVLGFSSFMSFEVRFSVFELLSNIVKHGDAGKAGQWVRVILERNEDKLSVTIVDKGIGYDPTAKEKSGPGVFDATAIFRGLGLYMTRKITNLLRFEREQGTNRTYFDKAMVPGDGKHRKDGGIHMSKFRVEETDGGQGGMKRLILEGDLDSAGALVLEEVLQRSLKSGVVDLELDFEKVPFVSSAGVGILLGMVSSMRSDGGDVVFRKVSGKIVSVFRLLNLEEYFKLAGDGQTTHAGR